MYHHVWINDHLVRIIDQANICCYLVIGKQRACLIDTCCGFQGFSSYVSQLCDLPIFVLLTHGHYDHIGGCGEYQEVYLHKAELPVVKKHTDQELRKQLAKQAECAIEDLIPAKIDGFLTVDHGDIFDLGDLHVKAIAVPGHTPGILCPLLIEDRMIFFGDACGNHVMLFDEFSSTVSEYKESLLTLKTFESAYDHIYRNHGTYHSQKILLDNMLTCCDLILAHQDDHVTVEGWGVELYAAKQYNEHGRLDGKEGNLLYTQEKAR